MQFEYIRQKIQQAKALDFGQIFNDSIELFKKVWLQGLIMLLITMAFTIPFVIIIYIPLLALGIADASNPGTFEGIAPFALLFMLIAYLLFAFAMIVISLGLKAALFRIMRQKDLDIVANDDYFFFLRKPYLNKTINLSLSIFGIAMVAALLCFLPLIYVMVPLNLLVVVYAFNPDMSTSNLIKLGFDLGNKKWFITFGLTLVAGLLAQMVGGILCGIGIFFTASFAYIPHYFIYKEVVGHDEEGEMKLIGENQDM